MNPANLSGLLHSVRMQLRHTKTKYAQRPNVYWHNEMRKYELASEVIADYVERSNKGNLI